ncbi:hypothetical protein E1295_33995 [Nonomuraea mesophila]|uniref:DUF3558 domain-containing protein n=1 Tax=Nonomuraea mesophila TaxID=2530382 RepID=A0A4R5ETK3_9ACTN|nr:hypothetical protein [Nonomuraea mesophila]TDE38060.1 hypothetical protein E1295_33995 [Nonomuraea mesophila]
MNEVPTPPRTPRPSGVRVTPGLLSGAMAVLVLMVFTVAFLLTRQEPPPPPAEPVAARTTATSAPPSTQPPASEPPPTGEAKFSDDADPCELVTEDLRTKLVVYPKQTKLYKEECEWTTLPQYGAGLPQNMTFRLKVYTKVFPDGVAQAHEEFVARRHKAALIPQGYAKAEPPVGDDSYVTVYTLEGADHGPTKAIAGVRVSNAVVEVEYGRNVTEDPEGRLTAGALEAARTVAEKLGGGGD